MCRDSSVIIATGYGLDGWSSIPGRGKFFTFYTASIPSAGTHPASYPVGTKGCFAGSKAAGA
jgi:hypothetical protein